MRQTPGVQHQLAGPMCAGAAAMTDNHTPLVSIIIPVLNGERTIRECVVSVLKTDYPPDHREILVVDNNSTDRTAEILKSLPVQYLREKRQGIPAARNRGIAGSRGEIVTFLDADCVVTTRWLRELVDALAPEDVGAAVGEVVAYPPETQAERYRAARRPLLAQHSLHYPMSPWFTCGNTAFRRQVFDQVGLFDPQLVRTEDIDFSWRFLQTRIFRMTYCPNAIVFHHHRVTIRELFTQYKGYGYGQALLCRKHRGVISWGWGRELRAYGDLLVAALAFLGALLLSLVTARGSAMSSYRYCELARKTAQRIGFMGGTIYGILRDHG